MNYSLQVNKKKQAGAEHPDRDAQFQYIAKLKAQFLAEGLPVISVDTKKEGANWKLSTGGKNVASRAHRG